MYIYSAKFDFKTRKSIATFSSLHGVTSAYVHERGYLYELHQVVLGQV